MCSSCIGTYRGPSRVVDVLVEGVKPPGGERFSVLDGQGTPEGPDEGVVKVTLYLHITQVRVRVDECLEDERGRDLLSCILVVLR